MDAAEREQQPKEEESHQEPAVADDELDSLDEIRQRLQQLREEELRQDAELRGVLAHAGDMEVKVLALQSLQPKLAKIFTVAKDLSEMVGSTCALAENVSSKVRELDVAKGRVQGTIARVDDLIELKNCVEGAQAALHQENYEEAAGHIHRFLSFDQEFLQAASLNDGSDETLPMDLLNGAKADLERRIGDKFDQAAAGGDSRGVLRFVKLYPLLHLKEEGLNKLCRFLAEAISKGANARSLKGEDDVVKLLGSLLEQIAKIIEEQEPVLETHFGPGFMALFVRSLLRECDVHGGKLIDLFLEESRCEQRISASMHPEEPTAASLLDLKELDQMLTQLVQVLYVTAMFFRFLGKKIDADAERIVVDQSADDSVDMSRQPAAPTLSDLMRASSFNRQLQELAGKYIALEQYFLVASVNKAISLQTRSPPDSPVTTVVDDVFYLLQKCCGRAVQSFNPDCVCAMMNHLSSTLLTEYLTSFRVRAQAGYPSTDFAGQLQSRLQAQLSHIGASSSATESADRASAYLVTMNDVETSQEYTLKLMKDLSGHTQRKFQNAPAKDKVKLESCVSDLSSTATAFKQLLEGMMLDLCGKALRSQLKSLVDTISTVSYELTEEQMTAFDGQSNYMQSLVAGVQAVLSDFQGVLLPNVYNRLVASVTAEIVAHLERALDLVSFNRLGGLQFDRDLRSLVAALSEATQWTIRDKFARLTQISTLLNLDHVHELADYWGASSGVTWRLTPAEVRRVLALRVDFNAAEINKLRL